MKMATLLWSIVIWYSLCTEIWCAQCQRGLFYLSIIHLFVHDLCACVLWHHHCGAPTTLAVKGLMVMMMCCGTLSVWNSKISVRVFHHLFWVWSISGIERGCWPWFNKLSISSVLFSASFFYSLLSFFFYLTKTLSVESTRLFFWSFVVYWWVHFPSSFPQ